MFRLFSCIWENYYGTYFRVFLKVMVLVSPKWEMEQKSKWFCGVEFYRSNFKVGFEQKLWFWLVVFLCSDAPIRLWLLLFFIFYGIWNLNSFPSPFIVKSMSEFQLNGIWNWFSKCTRILSRSKTELNIRLNVEDSVLSYQNSLAFLLLLISSTITLIFLQRRGWIHHIYQI